MGVSQNLGGYFLGVPTLRIKEWGSILGSPYLQETTKSSARAQVCGIGLWGIFDHSPPSTVSMSEGSAATHHRVIEFQGRINRSAQT